MGGDLYTSSTYTRVNTVLTCWSERHQHIGATHAENIANSMSLKNSTLSNLEEYLFSMMSENVTLLRETTSAQQAAKRKANDYIISDKVTNDGAKTATDCVTLN